MTDYMVNIVSVDEKTSPLSDEGIDFFDDRKEALRYAKELKEEYPDSTVYLTTFRDDEELRTQKL